MRTQLSGLTRRYGQSMILIPRGPGEVRTVCAFLQPVRKSREDLPVTPTPLGAVNDQRWLYLGPPDEKLRPGDHIRMDEIYLTVQETQIIYLARDQLYRRAVLRQEKEAAR